MKHIKQGLKRASRGLVPLVLAGSVFAGCSDYGVIYPNAISDLNRDGINDYIFAWQISHGNNVDDIYWIDGKNSIKLQEEGIRLPKKNKCDFLGGIYFQDSGLGKQRKVIVTENKDGTFNFQLYWTVEDASSEKSNSALVNIAIK